MQIPSPGRTSTGTLPVSARAGDSGAGIPYTIIRGRSDGPVLALVAGTHGAEYVPIIGLQRLRDTIAPADIRGTLLLVHVANMPSFLGRTVYYSPVDGQNLNRVFPGKPDGTLSERIADVITREVIARATHVVDLHGGDGNESLRPYSYWITSGDPEVSAASKALALAFGLSHIVVDRGRPTDPAASVYLSNTAITRGKPAITTETGCMGVVDAHSLELLDRGVRGVLRHLGMVDDGPAALEQATWIERDVVLRAGHTGLFYPVATRGHRVAQGAIVGRITDFHGTTLEEIVAPFDGEMMYVVNTPPINKGEPIGMVGSHLAG